MAATETTAAHIASAFACLRKSQLSRVSGRRRPHSFSFSFSFSALERRMRVGALANDNGKRGVVTSMAGSDKFFVGDNWKYKVREEEKQEAVFQKVREEEKQEAEELDEIERKVKLHFERISIVASSWSKQILKFQGKLRGTPCNPEPSHDISFSEFWKLLEKKQVNYMEYGDLGQSVAVILPYYKDGKAMAGHAVESLKDSEREIVFRRHVVKKMPFDCWTDVWQQLHQQLITVDVVNRNSVPFQVYGTMAVVLLWALRLGLVFFLYVQINRFLKKFYAKKVPERPKFPKARDSVSDVYNRLGNFSESRARFIAAEESTGITFDDFGGHDYVKRELKEIVKILKESEEFENADVYCPKGVLLFGPPGTGKTLLARALAGEAGVPFFACSGSEFVEMFAGVAASRVRDLFSRARMVAPSIIFIDEIDAIAASRGGPDVGGGGAERVQGLVQILTELDGFKTNPEKVLLVGATNRRDLIDSALMRKGRVDKVIAVELPTDEGRMEILKVHARNKSFRSEEEKEKLLMEVVERTEGRSGAVLQNILNEAGILCLRKDKDYIEREELMEALDREEGIYSTGLEDYDEVPHELKMQLAYREAAVAILECYYPNPHRPFVMTEVRSVNSVPNMQYINPKGGVFAKKTDYVNSIVRACAPRIVEEQIFGTDRVSWLSGAALSEAGIYAEKLIVQTGMTAFGKVFYKYNMDIMEHLGPKIQALRDEYVRYAVEKCSSVLKEYRSAVETIADILIEKDEISADEIWDIFRKAPRIPQPPVRPVDEYGALVYTGRWGIYSVSLPGRVTFNPGKAGYATYGAPRPTQTQVISDNTWKLLDAMQVRDLESEQKVEAPEVVISEYFL